MDDCVDRFVAAKREVPLSDMALNAKMRELATTDWSGSVIDWHARAVKYFL